MSKLTRRRLIGWGLASAGAAALAACAPKQAAPEPQPEAKQETAPKQEAPQPVQETIKLRFMSRQGSSGDHNREFAKRYSEESGGRIEVECEDTAWGDIPKKLETQLVTGTMVDLAIMSTRYFPYLAKRGAFLAIDDLVEKENVNLDEWFIIEWFRRWTDGKLSGLGGAAGLSNLCVFYNKDWVMEATGSDLTDDWTMDDLVQVITACVDLRGEGNFGTAFPIGGHVEADSWVCNWGGSYLDPETYTKTGFADPKVQDSLKFTMELLKAKVIPNREDAAEGWNQMFFGDKMAMIISNPGASTGMVQGCEENGINLGVVMYPKGPSATETPPRYGFCPYANNYAISAQTPYPDETFGLMLRVLSKESFKWLNETTGKQPGALLETWYDPDIAAKYPWFPKCADIMRDAPPYYPVPANTRYAEWQDVGNNEISPIVYGDVEYTDANIQTVADHLQEILDLPLPGE